MNVDWAELQPLLGAAAAGDAAARDRVVECCYPDVRARVHRELEYDFRRHHRWILPLFSTQDVVHEVLAAVVADLGETRFDGLPQFVAYLGTLVHHRLLDAVRCHEAERRDAKRQVGEITADLAAAAADRREAAPSFAASLVERAGLVRDALAELPERQRRVLELRLCDGEPFASIAEALGYSTEATARGAFVDAQAKLLVKLRTRGLGRTTANG